jgi:8-oxo-dGTP diphosphatase
MSAAPPAQTASHCYRNPRPAIAVDIVLLREPEQPGDRPQILLIQRGHPPFLGSWALPGGFVEPDETLLVAAQRELAEETGLTNVDLQQIGAFGDPMRDPRGWVVSILYATRGTFSSPEATAGDDAHRVAWWPIEDLPPLAFDHPDLIKAALSRI